MRLQGKVAIVTGAARGIGRAIALKFAQEGADLVVTDIDPSGEDVAEAARRMGRGAHFVQGDLRDEAVCKSLADAAVERFGRLDVLVNNAGVHWQANVLTAGEEEWRSTMDLNLKSAWLCCKHAIPAMRQGGGGSIVNIASTHAFRTQPDHFPYQVSKAGMIAMTLGICVDFGRDGIRANVICPGFIMTPMAEAHLARFPSRAEKEAAILASQPIRRFGLPEDVASAAAFLASDEASFISGATLVVDGGRAAYQRAD